jgi:hypothetical protein
MARKYPILMLEWDVSAMDANMENLRGQFSAIQNLLSHPITQPDPGECPSDEGLNPVLESTF